MSRVDITEIAAMVGTPFYVYDASLLRERVAMVQQLFPDFAVAYSLKANPLIAICKTMRSAGCWAEVASGGELLIASTAGFLPARIVFDGPAKQAWELEKACAAGVRIINAESVHELEYLASVQDFNPEVCLRINTRSGAGEAGEHMVGGPSRFGFDEEALPELLLQYQTRIRVVGIHVYTGSQMLDAEEVTASFARTVDVFANARQFAPYLNTIVFGGGFGVPNPDDAKALDLPRVASAVGRIIHGSTLFSKVQFILELGRYLVAEAGVFVSRIVDIKKSRGETFILTDGGINNFLRPAFMKVGHGIRLVNRLDDRNSVRVSVGGPLCTPLDTFGMVAMPEPRIGDLVGLFNAGAYGYSMSMHAFLGHRSPAEAVVNEGTVQVMRPRGSDTDLIKGQIW